MTNHRDHGNPSILVETFRSAGGRGRSGSGVPRAAAPLIVAGLLFGLCAGCGDGVSGGGGQSELPNILFVIMDDVGIDQMASFGYGGDTPPNMPTIEKVAEAGVRFRNTWAMPACSTSRAVIFSGRFPTRTNVNNAIGTQDLANSMTSPFETTLPRLLAQGGYESALFGKFHIALQGKNFAGLALPYSLGWNYFAGWMDPTGDPSSIDQTAGGVNPADNFTCGFVPSAALGGADSGACYMPDGSCSEMSIQGAVPPGRTCRDQGGILDPDRTCAANPPSYVDFTAPSGHYVSPLVFNYPDGSVDALPFTDLRARTYRGKIVVDEAIDWINERPRNKPWMATVSFATAHTPVMQPPVSELRSSDGRESDLDCSDEVDQRELTNLMIEALDLEVERLLVQTGLATESGGELTYTPEATNTVLVILGDNGTLGNVVKTPFDPTRAKATAYQTGAWVPLIVAGPMVVDPKREVTHMVNAVDLYQLFGELAELDVHAAVPRPIDSESMLPYLTEVNSESIRDYNYTLVAPNLQAGTSENGPCVIGTTCTQLPPTKQVCHDNNGIWWGEEPDADQGAVEEENCCGVNMYLANTQQETTTVQPGTSAAVRNDNFKLVRNVALDWSPEQSKCVDVETTEFYALSEQEPMPLIDYESLELDQDAARGPVKASLDDLTKQLAAFLTPTNICPGDGNIDFVVDETDLDLGNFYADPSWGGSSDYDFNLDGLTDSVDIQTIVDNLGTTCAITIIGQNNPKIDPGAVQAAVDEAVARGGAKAHVILRGAFNFGECGNCIQVRGPVTIEGTGDPSGQDTPNPSTVTTIDSAATAPFVIHDESVGDGVIDIERLWFRSSQVIAVNVTQLTGMLNLEQNRFTGGSGGGGLRFAVGGAGLGAAAKNLRGAFRAVRNFIDNRDVPFRIGDDNGFAFAQCDFDSIEIRDNRIYTRGEGVEVEGCNNPTATIEIVGNELNTDAAISDLAILTRPVVLEGVGGHPAVLKVIGTKAASVLMEDNDVVLTGWQTAICIMSGLQNEEGSTLIQNNRCRMSGQFAAVLAGWAGTPGFFPPFYLRNAVVQNNVFEGTAQYGVAFSDFLFLPTSVADLVNRGHGNMFAGNSFTGLQTEGPALFFGEMTQDNVFIGDPNGAVVDLGTQNQVLDE